MGIDVGQDREKVDAAEARRAGQHLGTGALHDVGHLDRAISRVHGDCNGAQARAGKQEDRVGRCVGQPERNPVARTDTQVGQALGGACSQRDQLREAQHAVAMNNGRGLGRLVGDVGDQRPQVGSGMGKWHAARRLAEERFISSVIDGAEVTFSFSPEHCMPPKT